MNIKLSSLFAIVFSGMGSMLLFVMVIFERSAFRLLFNLQSVDDASITSVSSALRMVIDVLPYTLGPFIVGTLLAGIWVVVQFRTSALAWIALALFVLMAIYNIFLTDTAGVVSTMKATASDTSMQDLRQATQAVMRQHHIGLLGFGSFFVLQWIKLALDRNQNK